MNKLLGESNELISPLTVDVQACKFTRTSLLCSMGTVFKSDWLPTKVDDTILADYVKTGNLDPQNVIGWRTGLEKISLTPKKGKQSFLLNTWSEVLSRPDRSFLETPWLS